MVILFLNFFFVGDNIDADVISFLFIVFAPGYCLFV